MIEKTTGKPNKKKLTCDFTLIIILSSGMAMSFTKFIAKIYYRFQFYPCFVASGPRSQDNPSLIYLDGLELEVKAEIFQLEDDRDQDVGPAEL